MEKRRILTIFSTRSETMAVAPLIQEFGRQTAIEGITCVAARHKQMLDGLLDMFQVEPHYVLEVNTNGKSSGSVIGRLTERLDSIVREVGPDMVLVSGNTSAAFAGSLAAYYNNTRLAYMEPMTISLASQLMFPAEMKEGVVAMLADMHFVTGYNKKRKLIGEGKPEQHIFVTGSTVVDAAIGMLDPEHDFESGELNSIDFKHKKVITVEVRRRQNWGEPLENLCRALRRIALSNQDVEIVLDVPLNPVTGKAAYDILDGVPGTHLMPVPALKDSYNLIDRSCLLIGDSSAFYDGMACLGKTMLLFGKETDRHEITAAGNIRCIGTDEEHVFEETIRLLCYREGRNRLSAASCPYGDGKATGRIVEAIEFELGLSDKAPEEFHYRR